MPCNLLSGKRIVAIVLGLAALLLAAPRHAWAQG
jgi:hypothetical protein